MAEDPKVRVARLRNQDPKRPADEDPEGRIPPGQYRTEKFPVLTYGTVPKVNPEHWRFHVSGLVEEDVTWSHEEFMALPQVDIRADFHCVTRWSQLDNIWRGVSVAEVMGRIRLKQDARYVMASGHGGYTTNLPLADFLEDDVLFAHSRNGEPLSAEHGWPLRLIVPKLYAWKSAKWVNGLEFMAEDRPGFWEGYGYHDHGDPWKEERLT